MIQFIHPLEDHILTRGFYYKASTYVGGQHAACDYIRRMGATRELPIRAVADGAVIEVGWDRYSGYFIVVTHANDWRSTYRHLIRSRAANTPPGSSIHQGQTIGHIGSTGLSQGAHLHFDLWCTTKHDDTAFAKHGLWAHDPELYLGKEDDDMALTADELAMLQTIHHFAKLAAPQKLKNLQDSVDALRGEVAALNEDKDGGHHHR